METSASLYREKKHWWMMNRKIINKHIRDARALISTQEPIAMAKAIGVLDGALGLSPGLDLAMELKCRTLLLLHRYREIADMLQDYIPSIRPYSSSSSATMDDSSISLSSSGSGRAMMDGRDGIKLLPNYVESNRSSRCFSIYDLKRKVVAGIHRACDRQGHWRYLVLGQACCYLGLLEEAMILLQTGRRLASAAFRRESVSHSDDMFNSTFSDRISLGNASPSPSNLAQESESAANLLSHIKLLLRRRAAATSALDAGLPNEAARHFSKILESRRGTPHPFAAACLVGRAAAYRDAGRIAEAIADCNRALSLEPASIPALRTRSDLLESVRCVTDSLHDLDHLKLIYDSIIRDRKLPGPTWRPSHGEIRFCDIPTSARTLSARIQAIRQRLAAGQGNNVDYYKIMGIRRGCSRSELERAHLLLSLRHKPDKAGAFIDRLDFSDEHMDLDAARNQAKMSALILYRLLQKGYSCIMTAIMEEEAAEKQRAMARAAASLVEERNAVLPQKAEKQLHVSRPVYQGVFCRDMAAVGSMLSRAMPVKYEALSC